MAATDARVGRAARRALKRIDDHYRKHGGVDSGAGPFCIDPRDAPTGANPARKLLDVHERSCETPRRDLQFDTVSLREGLSRREAAVLAKAIRKQASRPTSRPIGVMFATFQSENEREALSRVRSSRELQEAGAGLPMREVHRGASVVMYRKRMLPCRRFQRFWR